MSKTHYRKAFNSPYLSSADIVEPTTLTIEKVTLEKDHSKKTKDFFNTAYFSEGEIRPGEKLKPMILNATNSRMMAGLAGSKFIDDWLNIRVTVFVDDNVRFGRDTVEGLRIKPCAQKRELTPDNTRSWQRAIEVFKAENSLDTVKAHMIISKENEKLIVEQSNVA